MKYEYIYIYIEAGNHCNYPGMESSSLLEGLYNDSLNHKEF